MQSIFEILNAECQPDFIFIQVLSNGKWPNDKQGNRQFILDMIKAVKDNYTDGTGDVARSVGIMTNYNSWSQILGADWTGASNLDLLWVNWNGKQDLTTGWTPFGGWNAVRHEDG